MRRFSSLKGKKMKAHTKMVKVEEKRRLQARGVPRSRRTRGRGVYGGKLRALAVCTASIDTLSSVGITFLLSCVFSFTFSSSRSPSKSVGNPQARGEGFRLAAMLVRFLVISEPLGGFQPLSVMDLVRPDGLERLVPAHRHRGGTFSDMGARSPTSPRRRVGMVLQSEKRYNRPLFDPPKRRPLPSATGQRAGKTVVTAGQRSCLLASDRC